MRFGFNLLLWTVFVEPQHAAIIARLGELGFDGVELPVGMGEPRYYEQFKRMADDAGLACTACALATPETDPSSPEASVRRAALDHLRSRVDCAQALASPVLVGPLYAAHKQFSDPPPGEDRLKWAAEVLAQASEYAAQADVTLCLEPLNRFEIQLVNTIDEALRLVEVADHPNLAVHYDTHHAHIEEDSHATSLARCAERLGHVQLSESHRGTLGTGQVNWAAVVEGLRAASFDGWIVAESFGTGVEHLSAAACVHRNCFESRDEVMSRALPFMRELLGA
ncbi:MAG: sugar phosphate isomerase/epimerase family protein [Planctomycetota bacterium]|jgi:D-psicose/D-tagatose/L-ribulose 3-epimerase|nr:sugar phosphate isomerase/epimerase family protein [Planctomycetota bacterium]